MPLYFSLYLDIVRFVAAFAVFATHASSAPFTRDFFWPQLVPYGSSAVIIFFVLSGYVIAYVTSTREKSLKSYVTARTARIYSVVLVALILTFIFDNLGSLVSPDFYSIKKVMWKPQSFEGYISSLFFVNEYQIFNFNGISPGSNGPYWSLSFEITYYVIAGLFIFSRKYIAIPAIIIILLLAGKTIAALLPIWLLGYFLYFLNLKLTNKILLWFLIVLSVLLLLLIPYITSFLPNHNFGISFPWGRGASNRRLIQDYLPALIFAVNLVCIRELFKDTKNNASKKVIEFIRWLGKLTFPLYLIHFPAIALFASISPWAIDTVANGLYISLSTFVLVTLITPVCDRIKFILKSMMLKYNKDTVQ